MQRSAPSTKRLLLATARHGARQPTHLQGAPKQPPTHPCPPQPTPPHPSWAAPPPPCVAAAAAQVVPLLTAQDYWPVLACQDRYVRVLKGSDVCYEAPTQAAPVSLKYVLESHDPQNRFPNAKEVLYGTDTGERGREGGRPATVGLGGAPPFACRAGPTPDGRPGCHGPLCLSRGRRRRAHSRVWGAGGRAGGHIAGRNKLGCLGRGSWSQARTPSRRPPPAGPPPRHAGAAAPGGGDRAPGLCAAQPAQAGRHPGRVQRR